MTDRLKNKIALVTGAASGIGRATVMRFAAEGAQVVAADVNPTALAVLATTLHSLGQPLTTMVCDVTQVAETEYPAYG